MKVLIQDYSIANIGIMSKSILRTLTSPIKIINFIKIKISLLFRLRKSLGFPINILIEPTRKCNYNCIQCPRQTFTEIKNMDKMEITLEDFKHIMRQIGKYLFTIRFWHYGEPLINAELTEMIKLAKKYQIFTVLSSNCSLLGGDVSAKLIECKLDYLIVSLNAATPKTHQRLTQRDDFNTVVDNLKQFIESKKQMNYKLPFINLQFIVMKDNLNEIQEIKKASEAMGIDKLSFKYLGHKRRELGPDDADYRLNGLEGILFCSLPYEESVICANGDVIPCAVDIRSDFIMGNIFQEKFRTIWNNNRYRDFRRIINKDINSINICSDCPKKNNPNFYVKFKAV